MAELAADTAAQSSYSQPDNFNGSAGSQGAFMNKISEQTAAPLNMALLGAMVIAGMTIIGWIVILIANATYTSQIKTNERIATESTQALSTGTLAETDQKVTQIAKGIEQYKLIKATTTNLVPLLDDFKVRVVPETRLQRVSTQSGNQLTIEAESKSFVDMAKLIASFKKSSLLTNVQLVNTNSTESSKQATFSATYNGQKGAE